MIRADRLKVAGTLNYQPADDQIPFAELVMYLYRIATSDAKSFEIAVLSQGR